LSDGAVVAFAGASGAGTFSVNFADVPGLGNGSYSWKEAYTGEEGSGDSLSFSVAQDDIAVFKITASS
jgi:alpha-galactosidase